MPTNQIHVVVLGGGYAGVMAANRLETRDDVTVTLVNPRPHFVERIRLHQMVVDGDPATQTFTTVLNSGVHVVVDSAEHIDAAAGRGAGRRRVRLPDQ